MVLYTYLSYLLLTSQLFLYTYLILILMFLIPLFFLVNFQLFNLAKSELFLLSLKKKDINKYTLDQLFNILKILLNKKLWLTSINLMERRKTVSNLVAHEYFNAIGYLYESMLQFNLASLYYIKAVNLKHDYIIALQNLAKIYEKQNSTLALSTYKTIIKYDKNNKLAKRYIRQIT